MKITFIPMTKFAEDCLTPPMPAKKTLPDWYKKIPFLVDNEKQYNLKRSVPNTTLKGCVPFLDSLTTGYVFCLSNDIEFFKEENGEITVNWKTDWQAIVAHQRKEHPFLPSPNGGNDSVLKFSNEFIIQTPEKYSTLFTHPLNRSDLPFRTMSAIVETDTYMQSVQFPFQILSIPTGSTIIEKGTPICQFFPFKRDEWESEIKPFDESLITKETFKYESKIKRAYKSLHWIRKIYS